MMETIDSPSTFVQITAKKQNATGIKVLVASGSL
jgi:hypothetical protein